MQNVGENVCPYCGGSSFHKYPIYGPEGWEEDKKIKIYESTECDLCKEPIGKYVLSGSWYGFHGLIEARWLKKKDYLTHFTRVSFFADDSSIWSDPPPCVNKYSEIENLEFKTDVVAKGDVAGFLIVRLKNGALYYITPGTLTGYTYWKDD